MRTPFRLFASASCLQMTWDRALENTLLASKCISKEFEEWIVVVAKDGPIWRQQTQSKPKSPDV